MPKHRRPKGPRTVPSSRCDGDDIWMFRLYIAGLGVTYEEAHQNLQSICDVHFRGKHKIEVIDIEQHPHRASADNIIAIPTLVKLSPGPEIRIVGDLSEESRVLAILGRRATAE